MSRADGFIEDENYAAAERNLIKAYRLIPMNIMVVRTVTDFYFKTRQYSKASRFAERQLALDASNDKLIYRASVACYRAGRYHSAIDLGERMKLRDPGHQGNLYNLARTYFAIGNVQRSRKILRLLIEIDPENEKALKLAEKFEVTD